MSYGSRFVLIIPMFILFTCGQTVRSQSTEKFEVGAQVSLLQFSGPARLTIPSLSCSTPACLVIDHERHSQFGFGGRFAYNISNNVAVEAELNFFPSADTFGPQEFFGDGNNIQGLFGVKIGKRFEKVGIFAKARPGFVNSSKGGLRPRPETACIAVFPPSAGCFEPVSKTHLAVDIGGVLEFYPTRRTIIRFDVGDTIIHLRERIVPVVFSPPNNVVAIPVPTETTNNFQASIGIAFRF